MIYNHEFSFSGISNVKSAPVKAFMTQTKVNHRTFYTKLKSSRGETDTEISLSSLEVIAASLLSIVEVWYFWIPKILWFYCSIINNELFIFVLFVNFYGFFFF